MAVLAALAAASLASACARRAVPTPAAAARGDPDFLAPPSVTRAERDGAGGVLLAGRTAPGAQVALRSPQGETGQATADADGAWTVVLPGADAPRAFALSAAENGRTVRAEGAVLVSPAPDAPAVLMRGGAPAWPVSAPGAGLRWVSADMDAGGGAAASGFAPPGVAVRLTIDGVASGAGQADAAGRFGVLWLGAPVADGPHAVSLSTPSQSRSLTLRFGAGAPLEGAPARMSREAQGWRVDWAPPGGGGQTTLVLDAPTAPASAPAARASR